MKMHIMVTFDDKCITEREKKMRYTIQNNVGYNRLKFLIHMYFDTTDSSLAYLFLIIVESVDTKN